MLTFLLVDTQSFVRRGLPEDQKCLHEKIMQLSRTADCYPEGNITHENHLCDRDDQRFSSDVGQDTGQLNHN